MKPLRDVAVLGAGLMGHGIAQVFAERECSVRIYDTSQDSLGTVRSRIETNLSRLSRDVSVSKRVTPIAELEDAVRGADLVIEAVSENLRLKRELLGAVEGLVPDETILASNTSVIPITEIMSGLRKPDRALGTHWWNPPFLVPLVEVIGTPWTSDEAIAMTMRVLESVGKTPVRVKKDVAGFIGNRLQHALWREAIFLVEQGICDAETVDLVVKSSFGRRLGVLGPLENADLVGTDLTLAIHETILPTLCAQPAPSPYLRDLVDEGHLGMRNGRGFRFWAPKSRQQVQDGLLDFLARWSTERTAASESRHAGDDADG